MSSGSSDVRVLARVVAVDAVQVGRDVEDVERHEHEAELGRAVSFGADPIQSFLQARVDHQERYRDQRENGHLDPRRGALTKHVSHTKGTWPRPLVEALLDSSKRGAEDRAGFLASAAQDVGEAVLVDVAGRHERHAADR